MSKRDTDSYRHIIKVLKKYRSSCDKYNNIVILDAFDHYGQITRLEYARRLLRYKLGIRNDEPISKPPCYTIDHIIQFFVSKKSYERIYREIIEDMREEYIIALNDGQMMKVRFIVIRSYGSVVWAWLIQLCGLNELIRKVSKD